MDDFCLNKDTVNGLMAWAQKLVSTGKSHRISYCLWRKKRSLNQNALSHVWYKEISVYLLRSGRTYATEKWVKRNLKKTFLGYKETEYTDLVTGEKTVSWELIHTSDLDTGAMHFYMSQVEAWAAQFGLILTNPADGEYFKLQREQEQ